MEKKAIEMAKKEVGPNYKFYISGFHTKFFGKRVHYEVDVTAYNEHEIKDFTQEWDE